MTLATRIRRQLENPDGLTQEALEPLAQEYRQAVEVVNERLLGCIGLLRKGLRSEAIQRANIKPNIFDAAAELDLPEIEDWIDILRFYGMRIPPLVDAGAIAELNEALVDEQPLEELLRQHRRLAIAKAPLSWRLKVLRRIAQIDEMNTVWFDDILQWETIRLKQIASEIGQAITQDSADALLNLQEELAFKDWKVEVPEQLKNKVRAAAARKISEQQAGQAKAISEKLHSAFAEGNTEDAIATAETWRALISEMKSPLPDDLQLDAAPALEWVENILNQRRLESEHDEKSQQLERLLQRGASDKEELQRAMHSLNRLELGVDPILQGRFNSRIMELTLKERRRQQLRIASVAAILIFLVVSAGFWYWNRSHQASVTEVSTALQSMLDSGKLREAEGFFNKLSSSIKSASRISSLESKMNSLLAEEESRQKQVNDLIAEADNEDSSKIDVSKVTQAIKIAKTSEENAALAKLRKRWDDAKMEQENKDVRAIQDRVAEIESEMNRIQNQPSNDTTVERLEEIIIELRKLAENYPKGIQKTSKLIDLAIERGESLRGNLRNKQRTMAELSVIMEEIRSSKLISNYERQLKRYSERLLDGPFSRELKTVLRNSDKWLLIEKLNSMNQEVASKFEQTLTVAQILSVKQTRFELDKSISNLPGKSDWEKFLVIARYAGEREKSLRDLKTESLRSPFLKLVTLVKQGTSTRFFTSDQFRSQFATELATAAPTTKIDIPLVIDSSGNLGTKTIRGKFEVKPEPRNTLKVLSQGIGPNQNETLDRWEEIMMKQIGETLRNEDLDEAIKRQILLTLVETASSGSRGMDMAFRLAKPLLTSDEDAKAWHVDKTFESKLSPELQTSLKNAAIELKKIRLEEQDLIKSFARPRLVFVGGVLPNEGAVCEPTITLDHAPDGIVYALTKVSGSNSQLELVRVGQLRTGTLIRSNSEDSNLGPWDPLICDPSG
jgi:hypothetical protein